MKKREKSIFRTILMAMLLVLVIEAVLLVVALGISGVNGQLDQNAADILQKQVDNRESYLEHILTEDQELSILCDHINEEVQNLIDSEVLDITNIGTDKEAYTLLMKNISKGLINSMRRRSVTGIFVAFNTEDMDKKAQNDTFPVLYIRDLDSDSEPPVKNTDLLLERSPVGLVKAMGISTDKGWKTTMAFSEESAKEIIYPAFQAAYKDNSQLDAQNYGHWTTEEYTLEGDTRSAIAYSVPLIFSDGTVYGVVGIEILSEYLSEQMPYEELQNEGQGTYILANTGSSLDEDEIVISGIGGISGKASFDEGMAEDGKLTLYKNSYGDYQMDMSGKTYYVSAKSIQLYNRNAPFSDEQWILLGVVENGQLFSFSRYVLRVLVMAVLATVMVGILSSLLVSLRLARPVRELSDEVLEAQKNKSTSLTFSITGIRELDHFAEAITQLNRDMVTVSTKFLRIMEMASVELGGFEIRTDTKSVYVTDNFFSMLGIKWKPEEALDADTFHMRMKEFDKVCKHTIGSDGAKVYCVEYPDGESHYVRMELNREDSRLIGLVEDVTNVTRERMNIEHERDYDALTGLYNRRAFQRETEKLFRDHPEKLKHAAFLMVDMDNLKYTNDNFGHDFGDRYIYEAGKGFADYTPQGTICSRISGDEFNLLFYGYDSRDEIRKVIAEMKAAIDRKCIMLPSGRSLKISISGGVAWYPENTTDLKFIKKYADFAMYQAKRSGKGIIREFDPDVYNRNASEEQQRKQFRQMMRREELIYYYQPIVSAVTGNVSALEALMHIDLPMLKSPEDVLRLAKEEKCLHELERLTFFRAAEGYMRLKNDGKVRGDELLFVNSIANQNMTEEEHTEFKNKYGEIRPQLVLEITEQEALNRDAMGQKILPGFLGAIALDDYGSGYNSEKNLLAISPQYIKVDMEIIRDIDTDPDKQQIVANIVSYAHQRGMYIVAEGIETPAELEKVLELGVDLLQGYYLARPAAVPGEINSEAIKLIKKRSREV